MGTQVALVWVDNWQGLYVNERLVMQDHRLEVKDVVPEFMDKVIDRFDFIEASDAHMAMTGAFPRDLGDVVLPDGHTLYEQWEKE
jgi:hypothetical protein